MTEQEKEARKLVQWFFDQTDHMQWEEAKICAIKVCDEVIAAYNHVEQTISLRDWRTGYENLKREIQTL